MSVGPFVAWSQTTTTWEECNSDMINVKEGMNSFRDYKNKFRFILSEVLQYGHEDDNYRQMQNIRNGDCTSPICSQGADEGHYPEIMCFLSIYRQQYWMV